MLPGRTFIARHGETVFNAVGRMQGQLQIHTPLTSRGFAQAEAMGHALAAWLGDGATLDLWSSTAGRALQTLAIVAEHIDADWHAARTDDRLQEIDVGTWSGRSYAEIECEIGTFVDTREALFTQAAPGGEGYADVALRLRSWIEAASALPGDRLVLMHGMSARVLRGLLLGLPSNPRWGAAVAGNLPQGSMVVIEDVRESIVCRGYGVVHA